MPDTPKPNVQVIVDGKPVSDLRFEVGVMGDLYILVPAEHLLPVSELSEVFPDA